MEPNDIASPTENGSPALAPRADARDHSGGAPPSIDRADPPTLQAVIALRDKVVDLQAQTIALQSELASARATPMRLFEDYFKFRLLTFFGAMSPPLPARTTARFRRSAAKRDPRRSLPEQLSANRAALSASEMAEGAKLASSASLRSSQRPDPAKRTILVVSHEASRTGGPIVALNLAMELSGKYNIVNVILGGGVLQNHFQNTCVAFYRFDPRSLSEAKIAAIIKTICVRHEISYALVNSAESRGVLPGLNASGIPVVTLVHEFASYTRPTTAFADIFEASDEVVFSTRITLENALEQCGIERGLAFQVIAQGKCAVPRDDASEEERTWELLRLESALRPGGPSDHEFVVLGAGTIEPRKAVDLFIECATRVVNAAEGGRFRFVWIGNGYNPEKDLACSAYLADQMKRAGVDSRVDIVRATSEIEYAYKAADVLLLSSRLDPLPNVAIDCLVAGTPVLCFERTTGIADFLFENGLGNVCVARYLDTADMANKLLALAADRELWSRVAKTGSEFAKRSFDFARYAARLDAIGVGIAATPRRIDEDAAYLGSVGLFRADFFCRFDADHVAPDKAIRDYLSASRSGRHMRKPIPGFHPGLYTASHDRDAEADPFVRFLRDGQPEGPWSLPVIDQASAAKADAGVRAALHIHVSLPEALDDVRARLGINETRPHLFITVPADKVEARRAALAGFSGPVIAVEVAPDRGRDIAPLLTGLGKALVATYDIVGHLHLEAPSETRDRRSADAWLDFSLETLLGGSQGGAMLDRIVAAMAANASLGIVYSDDPNVVNWRGSRPAAENLAQRMGIFRLPDQINFPLDGMFWMRGSALQRFVALDLGWNDYPAEPLAAEPTMLEALKRLFAVIPVMDGASAAVANVRGLTR